MGRGCDGVWSSSICATVNYSTSWTGHRTMKVGELSTPWSIKIVIDALGPPLKVAPRPLSLVHCTALLRVKSIQPTKLTRFFSGLGWGHKVNCPHVGPGPTCGVPSVGVFLSDLSPYLHEFRRKPRKLQTARLTTAIADWTWHLPSISFEGKTAQSLVGRLSSRKLIMHSETYVQAVWSCPAIV